MSRTSSAAWLLLLLALAACGGNNSPTDEMTLSGNDYDHLEGWVPAGTVPFLTKEKAHSGAYSARINGAVEFAGGFTNLLGKLSSTRLKKITIKAWVLLPSKDAKAKLVVSLDNIAPDKNLKYEAIDLVPAANKFGSWVAVTKTIEVPTEATYNTQLKVYLWRAESSQPVYLDDLEIIKAE